MDKELVAICPRCDKQLIATSLNCKNCSLELGGEFKLSKFDYLAAQEIEFIEFFLRAKGNFKTLQNEKGMSYPAVKKKFGEILEKLQLVPFDALEKEEEDIMEVGTQELKGNDSLVVRKIKEKLNEGGGKAMVKLFGGDDCEIRFDKSGEGLISPKIPPARQLVWEAFDAAVEIVIKNNGKASKGNAQSGGKLGSDKLPLDSVEGYIAHKVHGVKEGETAFGPGFVIYAVLEWAGICKNKRGFIEIFPPFKEELLKFGGKINE